MLKNLQIHPQFCEVRMQKITGSDAPCERIKHASWQALRAEEV